MAATVNITMSFSIAAIFFLEMTTILASSCRTIGAEFLTLDLSSGVQVNIDGIVFFLLFQILLLLHWVRSTTTITCGHNRPIRRARVATVAASCAARHHCTRSGHQHCGISGVVAVGARHVVCHHVRPSTAASRAPAAAVIITVITKSLPPSTSTARATAAPGRCSYSVIIIVTVVGTKAIHNRGALMKVIIMMADFAASSFPATNIVFAIIVVTSHVCRRSGSTLLMMMVIFAGMGGIEWEHRRHLYVLMGGPELFRWRVDMIIIASTKS